MSKFEIVFCSVVLIILAFVTGYNLGYNDGQIDALLGKQKYKIEMRRQETTNFVRIQ